MRQLPGFLSTRLHRNGSSSRKGSRRLAVWSAALGAFALVAGVLQTASAQEVDTRLPSATTIESSDTSAVVGQPVTYTAIVTDPALGAVNPCG